MLAVIRVTGLAYPIMLKLFSVSLKTVAALSMLAGATATMASSPALAEGRGAFAADGTALKVIVDRAKVVRFDRSAKTIIIGNPLIVDATLQDSQTIVLTGRSFGVTNLIVTDEAGEPIMDETVVVGAHETNTVRIYRRTNRETLACSPVCEPTLTIGDQAATFDNALDQVKRRNELSKPQR